jgi:hypothetical protein
MEFNAAAIVLDFSNSMPRQAPTDRLCVAMPDTTHPATRFIRAEQARVESDCAAPTPSLFGELVKALSEMDEAFQALESEPGPVRVYCFEPTMKPFWDLPDGTLY